MEQPVAASRALGYGGRLNPEGGIKLGGLEANQERLLTAKHLLVAACGKYPLQAVHCAGCWASSHSAAAGRQTVLLLPFIIHCCCWWCMVLLSVTQCCCCCPLSHSVAAAAALYHTVLLLLLLLLSMTQCCRCCPLSHSVVAAPLCLASHCPAHCALPHCPLALPHWLCPPSMCVASPVRSYPRFVVARRLREYARRLRRQRRSLFNATFRSHYFEPRQRIWMVQ